MKRSTSSAKAFSPWAAVFWLLVWQAAALWVNEPIFLVSPLAAIQRLFQLLGVPTFWQSVWFTLGRILLGFGLSLLLALVFSVAAYRFRWLRELLSPLTATIKAIPVASFVILALLWVSSKNLSVLISLLIGFPVLYGNLLSGLDSTDPKLIEMAKVFRIPFCRQLQAIYLYQVLPFLRSGLSIAMGLCWKSGIAAEVIGIPTGSIGEKLYTAKVYLETADLFCWTLCIVLLSVGCEKLLSLLVDILIKEAAARAGSRSSV
ncbi:MAG: ABC transporter permease subunit [Eubacteriales bacterium]|nr:ABC transporter permease subunit [Eubacteriales bacterium]